MNVFAVTPLGILLTDESPQPGPTSPPDTLNLEVLDPRSGDIRPFPYPVPHMPSTADTGGPSPPASGRAMSPSLVQSSEAGYIRSGNSIWLTAFDASANVSILDRYDLGGGTTTRWFDGRVDGRGNVQVAGADARGAPIIQLASTDLFHTNPGNRAGIQVATFLLTAPRQPTLLNGGKI